jgi:predicted DNA-binding transcriptional regulator YafY
MVTTTQRVLACLELLQSRAVVTGAELAAHLEVHPRTVRRYVAALQELGIPVAGARGAGGGYRLRPGYRLPPLMLDDREAGAIVLGLLAAERLGLGDTVESALAKIRRVLPAALRLRADALHHAVGFTAAAPSQTAPDGDTLLDLAGAAHRRRRVHAGYTTHDDRQTERELSPHGLVVHAGRWYLVAHDHARDALRTFRVDRMGPVALGGAAIDPPAGLDHAAHVVASLAAVPWAWPVDVTLALPVEQARSRIAPALATLEETDAGHTRLVMRAESLDFAAALLAGLDCAFVVHEPDELRPRLRALARRFVASAEAR